MTNKMFKMLGVVLASTTLMVQAQEAPVVTDTITDTNVSAFNTLQPITEQTPAVINLSAPVLPAQAISQFDAQNVLAALTQAIEENTSGWQKFNKFTTWFLNNRATAAGEAALFTAAIALTLNILNAKNEKNQPIKWYNYINAATGAEKVANKILPVDIGDNNLLVTKTPEWFGGNIKDGLKHNKAPRFLDKASQVAFFAVVALLFYGGFKWLNNYLSTTRLATNPQGTFLAAIKALQAKIAATRSAGDKEVLPQAVVDMLTSLPQDETLTRAQATQAVQTLQKLCTVYGA